MERNQYIYGITRMDLRHLRYFVAVAEERHFTRAAERLGIKQPPLSLQIKQLEQELGTPLFRRLTRGVELTEPGTLLLDEARQILEQVERTKANVRNRARGETGHIRVGFAGATYFQPRVPGLIQAYRRRYPGVVLSPVQSNTPHLVDALRNGSVDVVCLSEIKSGHIRDAIRRGLGGKEYALPSLRCAIGAHPCPRPSACASHYSSERKISESGVDVPRPRQ